MTTTMIQAAVIILLKKLKVVDICLQIMNRLLIWLGYLMLVILSFVLVYYLYLGFLKAKDWVLSTFDMLYEYFRELFSFLQKVYEFVISIPEIVTGFFEDIVNKLVGGATGWFDEMGE
jgi:hypothetical protein